MPVVMSGGGTWYYPNGIHVTSSTTCTTWIPFGSTTSTTCTSCDTITIYSQPTDQELFQKALSEHNDQEAERLRNQIAQREQQREANRLLSQQKESEREVAKKRAQKFLLQHLTKLQQETFNKNGWFLVEGGKTKTKYRIRSNGLTGNIDVYKDDKITHRLCGHIPTNKVPIGDQLLAQKMMLESCEDDFLRIANRHVV